MAMTLRLNDEQDQALTFLAEQQGLSKQEAATRAIVAMANRLGHEAAVDALSAKYRARYAAVLDRLGQ